MGLATCGSRHHCQLQLQLVHTVAMLLMRAGLRGVPLQPPCALQVNAVKSQAVEGDKALIMADLIQVRLRALL